MTPLQRCVSLLIVALAFAARIWALDFKPPHFDEGGNGAFTDAMRVTGFYSYDAGNYHGPLHFYTLFASQALFGRNLWALRLPTVLIGTATVALVFAFRRFFGFRAVAYAALFLAVSPGMVFYSRYAIHEMWLPFFTLLAIYGGLGIARDDACKRDAWCLGLGVAGAILTKETWLLHLIAAGLALGTIRFLSRVSGESLRRPRPAQLFGAATTQRDENLAPSIENPTPSITTGDYARIAVVCYGVLIAFYSGFGFNWGGVSGMVTTFSHMIGKGAEGEGHQKETFYWLKLLAWYELPALAGIIAAMVVTLRRSSSAGLILLATGVTVAVACLIRRPIAAQEPSDFLYPNLGFDVPTSVAIAIAVVGICIFISVPARDTPTRWLALYTLASLAAYSLIPYKTPWCIVNIICPACLLLGQVVDRLGNFNNPWLVALAALALAAHSAHSSYRLNFIEPTSDSLGETRILSLTTRIVSGSAQPPPELFVDGDRYAYVQTTFDINHLLVPLRALVARDPRNRQVTGHVFGERSPLEWLLSDFPNIAYHDETDKLSDYDADFLIVPEHRDPEIEAALRAAYFKSSYRPRGGGTDSFLYLSIDRFGPVHSEGTPGRHKPAP